MAAQAVSIPLADIQDLVQRGLDLKSGVLTPELAVRWRCLAAVSVCVVGARRQQTGQLQKYSQVLGAHPK